jgi:hypothetical protein
MEQAENILPNTNKATPPESPSLTERITSQVLAKIGTPPRLDRLEICRHHHGRYRVNIWQQPEPDASFAVTFAPRIGLSYYLTVSDTGEIINSNPPLTRLGSPA